MLNYLSKKGFDVIGVGKIGDIFAMSGITETHPTHNNTEGMVKALELIKKDFNGLCFVNLVDFDMLYGHRQDIFGYRRAIEEFDRFIPDFTENMREDDLLIITADHGCDPGDESTDHTREYVPLLIYSRDISPRSFGTRDGFGTVADTIASILGVEYRSECGKSLEGIF
jgi:phosphopentomutase